MNIPYYERIVNMYYQGEMDDDLFFSLVWIDKKLKKWFQYHELCKEGPKQINNYKDRSIWIISSSAIPKTRELIPQKSKTGIVLSLFLKIAKIPEINDKIPLIPIPIKIMPRSTWIWIAPDVCNQNVIKNNKHSVPNPTHNFPIKLLAMRLFFLEFIMFWFWV